jgi:lipopolysaccharide export system ATP-binding protein
VPDIFSYFRRRDAAGESTPFGGDEAIDLETIGGAIDTVYRDIASVSAPVEKARAKGPVSPSGSPPATPSRPQRQPAPPPELRNGQGSMQGPAQGRAEAPTQGRAQVPPPGPVTRAPPRPTARTRRRSDGNGAAAPERKAFLSVHSVEKSFVGRKVVRGVSLYVRKGEAVGLLGPNGAGKTTVFYMITGLIKADEGHIELDGCDVTNLPMYQRARLGIGYLPQEASIFRGLTVEENIRAVLEVIEPDRKRRERDLDALLEEFNIARLRKTAAIALSGGERRRVEIARALATRPNYMLLDEPFAGIDPIAVGDIQALVRHLTNRGIGVLITDHNVRETLGLTDRAYIIYSGEVLMEGRADDIVNNPDVRRLYLGEEFRL